MRPAARLALGLVLASAGCRERAAPIPPAAEREPSPPVMPVSRVNVPLTYDITHVLGVVERAVPTQFGSMDSVHQVGDDGSRHYAFEATRGPFTAFATGAKFHLRATLAYEARGYYKLGFAPTVSAGCGTFTNRRPRLVVELETPLSLSVNWHLVSHVRLVRVSPASTQSRDRCEVRLLHYDVTGRIVDAARGALADRLPAIDSTIGAVDLTEQATGWWAVLNRPIRVADGVWLLLGPLRLRMGDVRGSGHTLVVHVGLDARPQIRTAEQEPVVVAPPLPPLAVDTTANGFHILLEGVVDYATASAALTAAVRGASVIEQGHAVRIDSVAVSPASGGGGRLSLSVAFHGDAQGTLVLVGVPRHDVTRHGITMPDLDYDLQTDSPLINVYSWLASPALRALLRARAVLPLAPALERGRKLLLEALNRKIGDAMTLSARIDSVAARGLYVTPHGLVLRAEAIGHATVAVREQ
jgi:Domain of unknown function (DUF4403)